MDTFELIWQFQEEIVKIYDKEELSPLRGNQDDYILNGREILVWYRDVTKKNAAKHNLFTTYSGISNDLFICSDELIYFTAHLYLYRPFINNPLNDHDEFNGTVIFLNNQNFQAKRYNMFADIVSQKTYNYWDRIGDLIASFFPEKIKQNKIYFSTTVDAIPEQFRKSPNYAWLKEFKENEYQKLNNIRKQIVHYTTTDTDYRQRHLESFKDREAMIQLQNDRKNLPEYYKTQNKLTIDGFEKTMLLLEEFNLVMFPEQF